MPVPVSNKRLKEKYTTPRFLSYINRILKNKRLPRTWARIGSGIDKTAYKNPRFPFVLKIGSSYPWHPEQEIKNGLKGKRGLVLVHPFYVGKNFEMQAYVRGKKCRRWRCKKGIGDHHSGNHLHVGKRVYQFDW